MMRHPAIVRLLRVDERRLERARGWFDRWGVLAIVFGRHLPGFRIVITVIAATMGVPYRVFAPSVAASAAIWAALGLWVGATFGQTIGHLLSQNPWIYLVALGLVIVGLAVILVRAWRRWDLRRTVSA
jgi:membrane-associated protein